MKEIFAILVFLVLIAAFAKGCDITINDKVYRIKFSETPSSTPTALPEGKP